MTHSWFRFVVLALLINFVFLPTATQAASPLIKSEFIFDTAPFAQCHASTITETEAGFVAAWFGGTQERNPDVTIWSSRTTNGVWSAPVMVADGISPDGNRYPCWNPVLFQAPNNPLMLFYKVGPSPSEWWGMSKKSTDNGLSWGPAVRLPNGYIGPVKNKPVLLNNGEILFPSSTEGGQSVVGPFNPDWQIHFERSTTAGIALLSQTPPFLAPTWSKVRPASQAEIPTIQPSILFLGGNRLLAIGRTRGMGRLFQVHSTDLGKTWGNLSLLSLPNPNAGTDAVTLKDTRHVLIYNHSTTSRSPLNLAISKDSLNWSAGFVLENEPGMEFSYPAVIQAKNGQIHVTYTWKRLKIKHVVFDPAKFQPLPIVGGIWPAGIQ